MKIVQTLRYIMFGKKEQKTPFANLSDTTTQQATSTEYQVPVVDTSSARGFPMEDEIDPIAEADVYMAYGRDAQAEEILKEAIDKRPDNNRAKLKLLEIYVSRRDVQSFKELAEDLRVATSEKGDIWSVVVQMNSNLGGFPVEAESQVVRPADSGSLATTDTASDRSLERELVVRLSGVLTDIRGLIDRGRYEQVTLEVKEPKDSEGGGYVITIKLK